MQAKLHCNVIQISCDSTFPREKIPYFEGKFGVTSVILDIFRRFFLFYRITVKKILREWKLLRNSV